MYVLEGEAWCSPCRETGPTELLSRKPHPTSQHQVPQPWTLSGSTCASLVRTYFGHRLAERVLGSLLCCCMLSGLRKGVLGVLCFQMLGGLELALQVGSGLSSLHTTPQSGHHARVSHSVNHPAFHPCVTIPRFHKHSFTLCRKTYQDILSLIFLRVPVSNDYLISFHFLLISGTWLYKN